MRLPRPHGVTVETPQYAGTILPGEQGRGVSPRQADPPQPPAGAADVKTGKTAQ